MPWTYDATSYAPRSITPGNSLLDNGRYGPRQSNVHSSAPIVINGMRSPTYPRNSADNTVFSDPSLNSTNVFRGRPRLPTEHPMRPIRQSFLNSRTGIDQAFNAEPNLPDGLSWCVSDCRTDFPVAHPTIPKRRRTSTGSVGFIDCTYIPVTCTVTGVGNRPEAIIPLQSSVSAILTSSVPTVQLVRGSWHCEMPPTTVCLQSTAPQRQCLSTAYALPFQSSPIADHALRRPEEAVSLNYQNQLRQGLNTLHEHSYQRKRQFCRPHRAYHPKTACSSSVFRSGHHNPGSSSKYHGSSSGLRPNRISAASNNVTGHVKSNEPGSTHSHPLSSDDSQHHGSSSDLLTRTPDERHACPPSAYTADCSVENESIRSSLTNSVDIHSGRPRRVDDYASVQLPTSSEPCCSQIQYITPPCPPDMTVSAPSCVHRPPQHMTANHHSYSEVTDSSPLCHSTDQLDVTSMNNLVMACRTLNDQQRISDTCSELENAGRNLSDTLGYAASHSSRRPGPQTNEATVVAAAAVASAAAHAVAAAAQAVSAAVQQRRESDIAGPDGSTQFIPRSSVGSNLVNQWTSPQISLSTNTPTPDRCNLHPVPTAHSSVQIANAVPAAMVANFVVEQGSQSLAFQPLPVPLLGTQPVTSTSNFNHPIRNPTEFGTANNVSLLGTRLHSQFDRIWSNSEGCNPIRGNSYQATSLPSVSVAAATQAAHAVAAAAAAQVAAAAASVVSSAPVSFLPGHMATGVQMNNVLSHAPLIGSQLASVGLMATPHPVRFSNSLLAIPSSLSQGTETGFFTVPTEMASIAAAAAVAAAANRAQTLPNAATTFQLATASDGSTRLVNLPQPIGVDRSFAHSLLVPQLSTPSQVTSVSVLPVHSTPPLAETRTNLSNTRDIHTLFQFLRLINQRQDPFSLPYYPSAMTATAGGSNASVVVSASMGGSNGSRIASAVTPPLVPHHPTATQSATVATLVAPASWQQSMPSSGFVFSRPTAPVSTAAANVQPTGSAAVALAAVAMAAAAALQHQTNRHIPANVMSMLSAASAAPTPSIPVPILHANLYYPTTVAAVRSMSVAQVPPCHHSHHGSIAGAHQHTAYHRHTFPTAFTASSRPTVTQSPYPTSLLPFFVTVPASPTRNTTDIPDLSSTLIAQLNPSHHVAAPSAPTVPSDPGSAATAAAAAVAAAAAAAAASVDTLYQLAVQLETSGRRGLTKEELDCLPVRAYGHNSDSLTQMENDKKTAAEAEDRCMICLDDYESRDLLRAMRCRHEFHAKCVDKWLKTKRTCPLCRADAFDGTQRKEELF